MSKTVNTRIKLKYDTLANWTSNNPKLLAGEIALVSVPAEQTADNDTTPVMYKVGDGTNNFTDLQWGSAKAADVYSWAKQSKLKVSLITAAGNAVTGIIPTDDGISFSMGTFPTTDTKHTVGATTDITNNLYFIGTQASGSSYAQSYCNPKIIANGSTLSVSPDTGGTIKAYKGAYYNSVDIGYGTDVNNYVTITNNTISNPSQISLLSGSNYVEVANDGILVNGDILSSSSIKSTKFITDNGTSAQFVKGDGSLDSNAYALASAIPTVNDGKLTLQVAGQTKTVFSANQASDSIFNVTAADLGLSAAMKFGGVSSQSLSEGGAQNAGATSGNYTTSTQPSNGTVYLDKAGHLEYVWVSGTSSALGHWELLGQDGSYALSSIKVNGTGALAGGGDLTTNRTITHNAGSVASKESGFYKFSTDAYSHVGSVTAVTKSDITALGIPSADTHYTSPFIVTVGSTTSSTSNTIAKFTQDSGERLTFLAGSNITLTPNTTDKTLTIANSYEYTLPMASSSALGGIKTGYTTSGKNYKVNVDTSGNAYVSVPWTDTDTNTWRTIRVDDQDVLSSETSSGALNFANGTYVQFSYDSGIKANLSNAVLTTDDQVIIDCGSSSVNVF